MKKIIFILTLCTMLTACASVMLNPCRGEENCESSLNSAPFSENYTESTTRNCPAEVTRSTQITTKTTVTTAVTTIQTTTASVETTVST